MIRMWLKQILQWERTVQMSDLWKEPKTLANLEIVP